jgi:hypothetical protein
MGGSVLLQTLFDVDRKLTLHSSNYTWVPVLITVQAGAIETSFHCEPLTLKGLRRGTRRRCTGHTFCSSKGYFPNIGRQRGMRT